MSWGYLIDRSEALGTLLPPKLSRVPSEEKASHAKEELDAYGASHTSEIHLVGRITLNVWRLFKHEIALTSYTFENLYYHVHHERVPKFSPKTLFDWWNDGHKARVVNYLSKRVEGNLTLLEKMDLIGR
jgi:DNA polymerase zeta